jgi:hypothetical protein
MNRMPLLRVLGLLAANVPLLAGCADRAADPPSWREGRWEAVVDTIGDTIGVHTVTGSQQRTARLVEELRIGAAGDDADVVFGDIGAIAVLSTGETLVYDAQAVAIRRFGPDGSARGVIAREGAGPGEYQHVVGMAVLPDDRIIVHDFGNQRFNVYAADGTALATWRHPSNVAESRPVHTHADGVYLYDELRSAGASDWRPSLVRLNSSGLAGDTVVLPLVERDAPGLELRSATRSFGARIPFFPTAHWTVTPKGEVVVADGARYAIDTHHGDGHVLRMSRTVDPVAVSDAERTAEESRLTARFRRLDPTWVWDGPRMPATKPPITWLHAAQDGAIWVRVAQPGAAIAEAERDPSARSHVQEAIVFDVYAPDGRFRGQVTAPDAVQLAPYPVIGSDKVWAVAKDGDGVPYVGRYRIAVD